MLRLSRIEKIFIFFAVSLSPLWFYEPVGIHFTVSDFAILLAGISFILRTKTFPLIPSNLISVGTYIFLIVAGLSLLWTPGPNFGITQYLQWLYIFILVVPMSIIAFQDRSLRRATLIGLWFVTNIITLFTLHAILTIDLPYYRIDLWFGNQNPMYWLIASAFIINMSIILDKDINNIFRYLSLIMFIISGSLVIYGRTLTAIVMILISLWLLVGWLTYRNYNSFFKISARSYKLVTFIVFLISTAFTIFSWEFIYNLGSLEVRFHDYAVAFEMAINNYLLGIGIGGSRVALSGVANYTSVHNFFLAHLLELGLVGAFSFSIILLAWVRDVFIGVFSRSIHFDFLDFAPISIFMGYLFVMSFQPIPLRRYWWFLFAMAYGTYLQASSNRHN